MITQREYDTFIKDQQQQARQQRFFYAIAMFSYVGNKASRSNVTAFTLCLLLSLLLANPVAGQASPDTVSVPSGDLRLTGLVWRPRAAEPLPAVLFTHGSGCGEDQVAPVAQRFVERGFVFVYLYRRGHGLSSSQGSCAGELMTRERQQRGDEARAQLQYRLMTTDHLDDLLAGLRFAKSLPGVDSSRIVVGGHSFGAQLAILAAEQDGTLKAALDFAGAANSWNGSPQLRERLLTAARQSSVPLFIAHAANDYSLDPGNALAEAKAGVSRPHKLVIYAAIGASTAEGHSFLFLAPSQWEKDVFDFLALYIHD